MSRFLSIIIPLAALLAGCGDSDSLPAPTVPNAVDTVTLGALVGTPITVPSGYAVNTGLVRTDRSPDFDFAYNVEVGGRRVFLPRAVLGLSSVTTADPGLQARTEPFDQITRARSNGYVTEDTVPVAVGERYLVRSRVVCSLGVPVYAKIEILSFEDSTVTFQVLANRNCGYRDLVPGLPEE